MTKNEAMDREVVEDGWRKMNFVSKAAHVVRNVTVEPLLGVFQLSMILSNLTTQNLNLRKACRVNLSMNQTVCLALENKNASFYQSEEIEVQQLVAGMMVWQNFIQNMVPCVLVTFVGSWSDRNRKRKPFMLLPVFGELVRNVGLIACVYFFYELPMEVAGVVESVPSSISGGMPVLFLAVFAYVGDISTVEKRTVRVGIVSLISSISFPVGAALSGILFQDYGFYGVYSISSVLYLFSFVYGIIVINDIKPTVSNEPITVVEHHKKSAFLTIVDFFNLKHVKEAFRVIFKRGNDNNRRTDFILLLLIMLIVLGPLSGEQSFTYLLTRVRFNWNEVDYGFFSAYYFTCNLVGVGLTLCVLVNYFGVDDRLIGAIGCLSKGLAAFVYAFAPTEFVFYLGPIVDIFHGTAFVAMRSILSKLVPANELGQALAIFSLVESIVPAIFRPLYSVIYQKTLHWLPGAIYVIGGSLNILGIIIFLWMYKKNKENDKCNNSEERKALSAHYNG